MKLKILGDQLKSRVKKICEGFRATLYPCPDTPQERREMSIGVMTRIEDLKTVLGQTQDHRHRVLVAAAKNVRMWMTKVRKIKVRYELIFPQYKLNSRLGNEITAIYTINNEL